MSVRTRVDAPQRGGRTAERRAAPRRVHDPDHVKSGAAKRAYARRRNRVGGGPVLPPLPGRSVMGGRIPFVVAILVLLGCGLMCTLLLTTRSAEDSYQLSDAREANQQLSDVQAELQRQVAAADAAPELATRARELGMIPAKDPARLIVAPNGAVTVIGKETAQSGPPAPPLNTPPPTASPAQAQGEQLVPVTALPNQNPADENAGHNPAQPVPGQNGTAPASPSAAAPAPTNAPAPVDAPAPATAQNPAAAQNNPAPARNPAAAQNPAAPAPAAAPTSVVPGPAPAQRAPAARVDQTVPVPNPPAPAPARARQAPPARVDQTVPVQNPAAPAPPRTPAPAAGAAQ